MCDEWKNSYEAFKKYMTELPRNEDQNTIDRINNDGGYEPGNVRWASRQEQANNRKNNVVVEYDGREQTASQWAREYGMKPKVVLGRLKLGWSIKDALETPVRGYGV